MASKHPYTRDSDTKQQVTVLQLGRLWSPPSSSLVYGGPSSFERVWCRFCTNPNGWVDRTVFLNWLKYAFQPYTSSSNNFIFRRTHHITMEVYNFGRQHQICIYVLRSHTSHIVQPLDLVFFGCLKHEWKLAVRDNKAISRFQLSVGLKLIFSR